MIRPRSFAGPDDLIAIGPQGCWTVPMPRPRVLACPRKSDICCGLTCDGVLYARQAGESIDAMVERIALLLGDGSATYTLMYEELPPA